MFDFENILEKFGIKNDIIIKKLDGGKVNETFLVEGNNNKYILQRVNKFQSSETLENQVFLRDFLSQTMKVSKILKANNEYFVKNNGNYYILSEYIENDKIAKDSKSSLEAGKGLAIFHKAILGLPNKIYSNHGEAHCIDNYLDRINNITKQEINQEKYNQIKDYLLFYLNNINKYLYISKVRNFFIHGDPKFQNMLFKDNKFLCMIDLDTVYYHNINIDIGDMMRSLCKDEDLDFNIDNFENGLEGYRKQSNQNIDRTQIIDATGLIILELGIRYIVNFFDEDLFSWDNTRYGSASEHNLQRIKNYVYYYESFIKNLKLNG